MNIIFIGLDKNIYKNIIYTDILEETMEKIDLNKIVDKLLDMKPDPIPEFVLLKEFKNCSPNSDKYQNIYEKVCNHPFVKRFQDTQNDKGFWSPFHGDTEGVIRLLLSYGLDKNHICLKKVSEYIIKALHNEESPDRFEKQDNVRWWPEMFMPLVYAATLSLICNTDKNLIEHRKRWSHFAENAFANGNYDRESDSRLQNDYFGFHTKRTIAPFSYYNFLLLSPYGGKHYLSDSTDQALVDYCINEADCVYYVYNKNPGELVHLNVKNRDSRDFCHWIRALGLISQFKGWGKYEQKYTDWILDQRNQDGLWEFPRKFYFGLSNSWRGKNKIIDSTIFVLRLLGKKQAF
jgi:hypothetical protein